MWCKNVSKLLGVRYESLTPTPESRASSGAFSDLSRPETLLQTCPCGMSAGRLLLAESGERGQSQNRRVTCHLSGVLRSGSKSYKRHPCVHAPLPGLGHGGGREAARGAEVFKEARKETAVAAEHVHVDCKLHTLHHQHRIAAAGKGSRLAAEVKRRLHRAMRVAGEFEVI